MKLKKSKLDTNKQEKILDKKKQSEKKSNLVTIDIRQLFAKSVKFLGNLLMILFLLSVIISMIAIPLIIVFS